jgi:hypothetical protein
MNTDPQNPTLDQIMSVVVGFYGRRESSVDLARVYKGKSLYNLSPEMTGKDRKSTRGWF